jgi:hypothetical protein
MNGGVSICFTSVSPSSSVFNKFFCRNETFFAGVHLTYQNHFEDTPREGGVGHPPNKGGSFLAVFF